MDAMEPMKRGDFWKARWVLDQSREDFARECDITHEALLSLECDGTRHAEADVIAVAMAMERAGLVFLPNATTNRVRWRFELEPASIWERDKHRLGIETGSMPADDVVLEELDRMSFEKFASKYNVNRLHLLSMLKLYARHDFGARANDIYARALASAREQDVLN